MPFKSSPPSPRIYLFKNAFIPLIVSLLLLKPHGESCLLTESQQQKGRNATRPVSRFPLASDRPQRRVTKQSSSRKLQERKNGGEKRDLERDGETERSDPSKGRREETNPEIERWGGKETDECRLLCLCHIGGRG